MACQRGKGDARVTRAERASERRGERLGCGRWLAGLSGLAGKRERVGRALGKGEGGGPGWFGLLGWFQGFLPFLFPFLFCF